MAVRKRAGGQDPRCSRCGAALRPKDRFCPSCGAPREIAPAPGQVSASLQVGGQPEGSLAEQRKVVTILFADLTGSTPLAERLDPEELRGILGSYFNALAKQIQRYEGTIDKYIGDAVMAVFGAPVSHEDDAERAISAALAMQGAIAKLNDDLDAKHGVRLALRIGINTGEVVGLLGGDVQAAYTVVGDAVNTAQRFEAAATPGQILASEPTRQLAIHSFEFARVEPLVLKGKSHPVNAYRVVARRYEEIAPEATAFVGRSGEIERLRGAVISAVLGHGGAYHVSGEAGVGKSRLVGELRAGLAAGIDQLTARCASFERNSPYALVADLIRGTFRIRDADDQPTARRAVISGLETLAGAAEEVHVGLLLSVLGYPEELSFEPDKKRQILLHLLGRMLRGQSERAPFVITAEDLHWVDDASIAVLGDLVAEIRNLPALLITTSRPEWTPPWTAVELPLEALGESEAQAFIEASFGVAAEADLLASILARTGGNPFFIEEVVRALKASDLLVERTGRVGLRADGQMGVPATIQEVLEARLDGLHPDAKATLSPAAVIGRSFWYRLLERVARRPSLPEDIGLLEDEELVSVQATSPELTYVFRQPLVQEVAYQMQLLATRRETHGRIAEAIEAMYAGRLEEFTDLLAYHYARSDHAARALEWLVRAGDRARRLYANDEAMRSYREALARGGEGLWRMAALEGLGDVHAIRGELDAARERYGEALAAAPDDAPSSARLQRKTGFTYMRAADFPAAGEWQQRALATIGSRPSAEVAPIWLDIGQTAWRQGRFDDAIAACRRGIAAAEKAEMPGHAAEGLRHLGTALVLKGEREEGASHYRRALEVYGSLNDPFGVMAVRNNLGVLYRRQDRWDDALREQGAALEIARRIGDAWSIGTILTNNGEALRYQGRHADALAAYEEALRIWTQVGDAAGIALQHMNIGLLQAERGEPDIARASLLRSLELYEQLDSKRFLPELFRTLAKLDLPSGPAAASGWASRALEVAREIGARDEEALALQILGRSQAALGDMAAAIGSLEQSIGMLRQTHDRLELARSLLALADASRRDGRDPQDVRRLAQEAAELFAQLGATADRAEAEALQA